MLFLLLISAILIFSDGRYQWAHAVRHGIGYLAEPILYASYLPKSILNFFAQKTLDREVLEEQYRSLQVKNLLLERRMQQLAALKAENQRLRALLNSSEFVNDQVLIAEVIAIDPDPFRHEIILNRGGHDGMHIGLTVLDEKGLLGQVVRVGPHTSRVLLITDPRHAVPVQVNRSGVRAISVGTGLLAKLSLTHVTDTADIRVGDLLVSSGLGGRFPSGYPVAEVAYIEHDPGKPFAQVEARPKSELDKLYHVLIVMTERVESEVPDTLDSIDVLESS